MKRRWWHSSSHSDTHKVSTFRTKKDEFLNILSDGLAILAVFLVMSYFTFFKEDATLTQTLFWIAEKVAFVFVGIFAILIAFLATRLFAWFIEPMLHKSLDIAKYLISRKRGD